MKIAYDAKYLDQGKAHSAQSGHGVHARELLRHLMVVDRENRWMVYTIGDPSRLIQQLGSRENFRFDGLPVWARNSYLRNAVSYPLRLYRDGIDILVAFTTLPSVLPCRTVLLLADIFWISHPEWLPKLYSIPLGYATRRSAKRADRIVTHSSFSKGEIVRYLRVPETKIDIVPHGVGAEFFDRCDVAEIQAVKARHGIHGEYILSVNDIHPRKNQKGLVQAFCRLREKGIRQKLVLVGRALWSDPGSLQRGANEKYRDDIILTGYVPASDLLALYQGASVFVYPSFYEGWGLPVREAMASGAPVVISNRSSLPEVAGDAALMFDPDDTANMAEVTERVLTEEGLRKELIARGLERAKRSPWIESARRLAAICNTLR